jgi:L-lysine 6-transaminase
MPHNVHETLSKFILTDGFSHVADLHMSHGSWFYDARTNQRYLDCYSMHASQPLGWNWPSLNEEVGRLFEVVTHNVSNSDCYTTYYADFVKAFAKITPDFARYFFIAGGALAVENALKAAFDYKARRLCLSDNDVDSLDVIHLQNAFHGRSGYTLSLTNTGGTKTDFYPKFRNWTRLLCPAQNIWGGRVEEIERIALDKAAERLRRGLVAAVLLEPIQSEGGDNHFRKEFLKELRQLTHDHDAMLILDEVQTGVGMTGKMWCYEHFGIVPDMIAFGKKTQVCGFASTNRIDNVDDNVFKVSGRINSTWGGNLVDMVRATIFFEIIEKENLLENAEKVGAYFFERLQELGLVNLRGRGLMIAFDLHTTQQRDDFFNKLGEKMLCLKCGQKSIRFRPPLTFSNEDVDVAVSFVKEALGQA